MANNEKATLIATIKAQMEREQNAKKTQVSINQDLLELVGNSKSKVVVEEKKKKKPLRFLSPEEVDMIEERKRIKMRQEFEGLAQ
ncbi:MULTISPECIES: hypothetical protein [Eubacterium]|uniref:Uncharacterized protein n=1 Tax=Eubacterium ruminantium TaxID=42322 RepID=A0A1T4KIW2_9FIRM|nr:MULTISPECIES: hypothetical protein [Eubacterium]MCR5367081.1 hypothetical protein [Eubacterium sp.]SCW32403.1 hypothetical protein SAMN05660484_00449 [Eubacterium ruminantium]SDM27951.1 hypothetical protein SAMN04490370_102109 [Eubacterium ruminantium]SJZ42316.1 hypothetical protein SAMN02745110_00404 [Eubacterium ruminantium]